MQPDGAWAVASDDLLAATIDGDDAVVDVGDPVERLAVWHGAVWVVAAGSIGRVVDGEIDAVASISGDVDTFHDGGRLWFVSPEGAVAIGPDQVPTVFELTAVDLDVCVNDCSPDDAIQFGDRRSNDDGDESDAEGAGPDLIEAPMTLPPVLPTVPPTTVPGSPETTTSTTTSTTTIPLPISTVTTTAPPTTVPPNWQPPTTGAGDGDGGGGGGGTTAPNDPPSPGGPATSPPTATTAAPRPPAPPTTRPPRPPAPTPPPSTQPPGTATPTTPPPVTSATTPPQGVDLVLQFADGGGPTTATSITVNFGWRGDRRSCPGAHGQNASSVVSVNGLPMHFTNLRQGEIASFTAEVLSLIHI